MKILLPLILILFAAPCFGENKSNIDEDLLKYLYPELRDIKSFGIVTLDIKSEVVEKAGLNKSTLSDYLKLKYKNTFSNVPYKDISNSVYNNIAYTDEHTTGVLSIEVWFIGNWSYHMFLEAGTWEKRYVYFDDSFAHSSKEEFSKSVKKSIEELVDNFAFTFYKVRDEL